MLRLRAILPGISSACPRFWRASSPNGGCKDMVRFLRSITRSGAQRAGVALALALAGILVLAAPGWADQPRDWQLGFQPSATPVHDRITAFHDELLVIITLITIFVLGLLAYVMAKFHHTRNPVPTRVTHNTLIEVLWTIVPVLILVRSRSRPSS